MEENGGAQDGRRGCLADVIADPEAGNLGVCFGTPGRSPTLILSRRKCVCWRWQRHWERVIFPSGAPRLMNVSNIDRLIGRRKIARKSRKN